MSLDVYLEGPDSPTLCLCHCGHQHERIDRERIYESNITHNLGPMAKEAGIYMALWRPDEIGITTASQLIVPLTSGLANLEAGPAVFEALAPKNGWGTYKFLVQFVRDYLRACVENPAATVRVSR